MKIQQALEQLIDRKDLPAADMELIMRQVMTGEATPAQIGGFLIALRMKGETVDEVAAAAKVMRSLASGVTLSDEDAIDIVGTGGDATSTFNVSTCSAIVAAAAGARVAKHGNRSVSSKSGAADLLEEAGVNIDLTPEQVAHCVDTVKLGFMFAPRHHSAMKHAIGPRREMGVRTVFNLLGPLTNPAGARSQLLGVYDRQWVRPVAEVLDKLGSRHVIVVHGHDGMDEISISGPTQVAELRDGQVTEYVIEPSQFGIETSSLDSIKVSSAAESFELVKQVLANEPGAARDIVVLNAGAALCVAGVVESIAEGVTLADQTIASGAAARKLAQLIAVSQSFSPA
ncbi:anthranilate phosphoribosyltransferase [Granulosicoccus antarcticus]|uniref:Anthranilate phosphoribosyltransferase n=1 Tax=Granulosicoccus antarcticus IMCC3135 TaxID=1192854 RepID=A0A2Z2NSH6_9GAMM|nr:anthranilate phosphoribosyltransferase [Granulosicoccus antarcticus]ASJ71690.1 Anthranilate phosphoribosyltransferase [Granulosicoccus antarcticus IMCC3135]